MLAAPPFSEARLTGVLGRCTEVLQILQGKDPGPDGDPINDHAPGLRCPGSLLARAAMRGADAACVLCVCVGFLPLR